MAVKGEDPLKDVAEDEPIFVLRAHDKLAPIVLRVWTELAEAHGCPAEQLEAAFRVHLDMRAWAVRRGAEWGG